MADVEKHVETVFSIRDNATKHLEGMHKAAAKVSEAFNQASRLVGAFGGIAAVAGGAFGAREVISGTLEYIDKIKKIRDVTGLAAEKADGLMDTFKKAGISGDETVQALQMMSKAGARMELAMGGVQNATGGVRNYMRQLGVDVNKGPEAAFTKLAKMAHEGKVSTEKLALAMRVPFDTARKMMNVLKLGPEEFRKSIDELSKKGIAVNDANLIAYTNIQKSQNNIKALWERITLVVGTSLLPVIEDLLKGVEGKLEGWVTHAKTFGNIMSGFLRDHYELVKRTTQLMLVNYTLMKTTGGGVGEWMGKGAGALGRFGKNVVGARDRGRSDLFAMMQQGNFGLGMKGNDVMGLTKQIVGMFWVSFRPLLAVVSKVTVITAVIAFMVEGFIVVKNNVEGIRDRLLNTWETIVSYFKVLEALVQPVMKLFGSGGMMGHFFEHTMVKALNYLADLAEGLMQMTIANILLIKRFKEHPLDTARHFGTEYGAATDTAQKLMMYEKQKRAQSAAIDEVTGAMPLVAPSERSKKPDFIFNDARFDITQKFAEGYDPDRIAVAFTNDLASMGERGLQSQFSQLFGVR